MYHVIENYETLNRSEFEKLFGDGEDNPFQVLKIIDNNSPHTNQYIRNHLVEDGQVNIQSLFNWSKNEEFTVFEITGTVEWNEDTKADETTTSHPYVQEKPTEETKEDPFKPGTGKGLTNAELWSLAQNGYIEQGNVYVGQYGHKIVFTSTSFETYYTVAEKQESVFDAPKGDEVAFRTGDRWSFLCNDGSSLHNIRRQNRKIRF